MNADLKNCARFAVLIAATVSITFGVALYALAVEPLVPAECRLGGSGCTLCHIAVLAINITDFLMKSIAFPAAVLLLVIGGLTLLISGASDERRTLGKKILTSTIVGLIIVMLAWLGVDTIIKVLTGSFDFGGEPGSLFVNFMDRFSANFGPWNGVDPSSCPL